MASKLVLVTGAGFSVRAGVPIQSRVLSEVNAFLPRVGAPGRGQYSRDLDAVRTYLNSVFLDRGDDRVIDPADEERLGQITLEDAYTILDKALARRDSLLHHPWARIAEARRALSNCVLQYLVFKQSEGNLAEYESLAGRLMEQYGENWSTITLNWDTVWDKALMANLRAQGKVVDYACTAYWISTDNPEECRVPSAGDLGTRLLKLHGSFNWATCPRCRTIFVSDADLGQLVLEPLQCPRCLPDRPVTHRPCLEPIFLTPTILKSFDNPCLNIVWDQALHTLADADYVVFVGYSFPLADHDLRYLLRKALPRRVEVHVVLSDSDNPERYPGEVRHLLAPSRYKAFFGLSDDAFHYDGWEAFFEHFLEQ